MTEQEVEALGQRLTRVWRPDAQGLAWDMFDHVFRGRLAVGVLFQYWLFSDLFSIACAQSKDEGALEMLDGVIYNWAMFQTEEANFTACEQFAARWMPLFRRNCWLSGANIEASAHEKMEWIEGFTPEEIEAWNLKM